MTSETRFATHRGQRIAYDVTGDGPAVVLQHGLFGNRGGMHDTGYVRALSDAYRVVCIDSLGHGESDKPHIYVDDYVSVFTATPRLPARRVVGKQANWENIAAISKWFRNSHTELHDVVAEGDRVAIRHTWTATVIRDMPGLPAGSTVRADGSDFYTVRDGLIVEVVDVMGPMLAGEGEKPWPRSNKAPTNE